MWPLARGRAPVQALAGGHTEAVHRVVTVLGLLMLAWVVTAWTAPAVLPGFLAPGVPGLDPGYEATYAAWDAALRDHRPEDALAAVDEFLLGPGASGPEAQSAWGMRAQALQRGAVFVESPAERGQTWRLTRVAARRPLQEWIALAIAAGLMTAGWLSGRRREPILVETRPVGPRPFQNLPPPLVD